MWLWSELVATTPAAASHVSADGETMGFFTNDELDQHWAMLTSPGQQIRHHPRECERMCYFLSRRHPEWERWQTRHQQLLEEDVQRAAAQEDRPQRHIQQ